MQNLLLDKAIAQLNRVEKGIVRTLLYFDIFSYPLTTDEIIRFHPQQFLQSSDALVALQVLTKKSILFRHDEYYSLNPEIVLVQKRKRGNELAQKSLKTAQKFSALISQFPFVRGIMLSGSISKDFMDEHSDIDYFIITQPGRLWLTRGLLALFKRVFLLNSHKFFCTNYLVDTQSLEIEEKNLYTAMEAATLIPVYGRELCNRFIDLNKWTKDHFPNLSRQRTAFIIEKDLAIKRFFEKVFSGRMGDGIDRWMMKLAILRWKRLYGNSLAQDEFNIAFKSKRNISKNHPRFFQKRILRHFQEKIERFETLNNLNLWV